MVTVQGQSERDDCSDRGILLEQAIDVILKLNDKQLNILLSEVGYVEKKAV